MQILPLIIYPETDWLTDQVHRCIILIQELLSMYGFGQPFDLFMVPVTGHGFRPGGGVITPLGGVPGDHWHGVHGIPGIIIFTGLLLSLKLTGSEGFMHFTDLSG